MKLLYELYIRFMVWLGAAPPPGYEYLLPLNHDSQPVKSEGSFNPHNLLRHLSLFILIAVWVIGFGWLSKAVSSAGISNLSGSAPTYFPSMQQIVIYYGDSLISGPMAMTIGGGFGLLYLLSRKLESSKPKKLAIPITLGEMRDHFQTPMLLLLGIAAFGIGSLHFMAAYVEVAADLLLRFDPTQVTEITVERLDKRGECAEITLKDKAVLTEGMNHLTTAHQVIGVARVFFWDKGGYLIHLKVPGSILHYRYLLVYKYRGDGRQVQAVAPFLSPPNSSPTLAFSSPEFHEWLAKYIDPYFENCPLEN